VSGTSAVPNTSDGSRIQTVGSPICAEAQASTKYSGGETSTLSFTCSTTPVRL
jgi:hypothetical protein